MEKIIVRIKTSENTPTYLPYILDITTSSEKHYNVHNFINVVLRQFQKADKNSTTKITNALHLRDEL